MDEPVVRMPSHDDADLRYRRRSSADQRATWVPSQLFAWSIRSRPLASMLSRLMTLPSAIVATSTTSLLDVGTMHTTGGANWAEPYDWPGAAEDQQPSHACHRGPALAPWALAELTATIPIARATVVYFVMLRMPGFLIGRLEPVREAERALHARQIDAVEFLAEG